MRISDNQDEKRVACRLGREGAHEGGFGLKKGFCEVYSRFYL